MNIRISIILLFITSDVFSQVENAKDSTFVFESICKIITEIEEVREYLQEFTNQNEANYYFVPINGIYFNNDIEQALHNSSHAYIWSKVYIFQRKVDVWFEFSSIEIRDLQIIVRFRSFNRNLDIPNVHVELKLYLEENQITISHNKIKIE